MAMTGETKSSAVTVTPESKNAVVMSGLTKPGAGWDYDDPYLAYDSATDLEGREVRYESIGQTVVMTPLAKNNA